MKMMKEACSFIRSEIVTFGGTLTFEDLSMAFSSFPPDVQTIIGPNVPAFKNFIKDHPSQFALTKSGNGVTLTVDMPQTTPSQEEFRKADQEARDYLCWFLKKAGGSMDIYELLGEVPVFPKHIRDKTGRKFKGVMNFIKRHPGYLLLTGTTVRVTESAKSKVNKPNIARQQLPAASNHQVPQEVIMWSWGKGTVIAVGSTFGYLQGFLEQDDLVVVFDSDSALFEDESTEYGLSMRIQTGDVVSYVAYACPETPDNRCTWKALVVWKSNLSVENCLFNSCVRVVQGKVTRVFGGGGSVTLGKSSDIRIPFSTSVVMCRSPVREANKMVSVGDRVACVLREATVEHLPCLVVECVWKTELFDDPARDEHLKVPPVTSNQVVGSGKVLCGTPTEGLLQHGLKVPQDTSNQVYGSGKVLCITPTGGLLQHGDLTIAFESCVLYMNGKTAPTSKLSKGTTVFYYAMPSKDSEVTLKATLVWKGKKPKSPASKDGPTLSTVLPGLEDQKRVNFLARDSDGSGSLNGETPIKVPGSTSLDAEDKGGTLLDDSESSQSVVEYLHLQNGRESEDQVSKVSTSPELEKDTSSTVKDEELRDTRHVDTQTISTGDIITLRLHTS